VRAYGYGYGIPSPGRRLRNPILWKADYSTLTPGAVAGALPGGVVLLRASTATVRTGASTVVTGVGTDVARCGSLGLGWNGLLVEAACTNLIPDARAVKAASWTAESGCTVTLDYAAGPDGVSSADRSNATSTGRSTYFLYANGSALQHTASAWMRTVAASGTVRPSLGDGSTTGSFSQTAATNAWTRIGLTRNNTTLIYVPVDGRASYAMTAMALDVVTDMHQLELGRVMTEFVPTSGGTATRAGERLYLPAASQAIAGGHLRLHRRLRPKGSIGGSNDYGAAVRLWTVDANNYASVNPTTGVVTSVVAGASYATASGFTFAPYDDVQYWYAGGGGALNTVVKARKNGGAVTTLGTSGAAQGTIPSGGTLDLGCDGTASQFTAWSILDEAYAAGKTVAWAA
jgi:hypothetical protein